MFFVWQYHFDLIFHPTTEVFLKKQIHTQDAHCHVFQCFLVFDTLFLLTLPFVRITKLYDHDVITLVQYIHYTKYILKTIKAEWNIVTYFWCSVQKYGSHSLLRQRLPIKMKYSRWLVLYTHCIYVLLSIFGLSLPFPSLAFLAFLIACYVYILWHIH